MDLCAYTFCVLYVHFIELLVHDLEVLEVLHQLGHERAVGQCKELTILREKREQKHS